MKADDLSASSEILECQDARTFRKTALVKFIICSIIGVLFFLTPIFWDGEWTIGIGVLASLLKSVISTNTLLTVAYILVTFSAISTLIVGIFKPTRIVTDSYLSSLFYPTKVWFILRIIGGIFVNFIYWQIGPEWVYSNNTGGLILNDLNPVLIPFFLFAMLLLPFLVDYGLMEFVGILLSRVFHKIFRLPGRVAIDAMASWLGSSAVGVIITSQQYERGFYSARQAFVAATNFSVASIAFSLLIVSFLNITHLFLQFYAVVVVTALSLAMIMPRIPPLSRKKDTYIIEGNSASEMIPQGISLPKWAVSQAVDKAERAPSIPKSLFRSIFVLLDVYMGLLPLMFAIGTIALAISEYTPIFTYLSYPFIYYLELLGIPEAAKAAPTMLVGFADMFLPAVLGHAIESELTRFVIACVSVVQIIYLTEVGALILRSQIPLNFLELLMIFLIRTIIALPIIAFFAHFVIF